MKLNLSFGDLSWADVAHSSPIRSLKFCRSNVVFDILQVNDVVLLDVYLKTHSFSIKLPLNFVFRVDVVGEFKVIYFMVGFVCIAPGCSSVVVVGISILNVVAKISSRSFRNKTVNRNGTSPSSCNTIGGNIKWF